ncbi:MAG: DUF4136 domain-containing protein [Bacteroidetes bacterium]|nr:DUF4136 domain-containing protein [Bacteroidota bacterium]
MKTRFSFMFIMMTIISFMGCSVYTDVSTSVDVEADFSKYQTFAWLPDQYDSSNLPYNNEIIRNNIRNYFGQSFAERGYSVNLDTPDVLLKVIITRKKMEKVILYSYPWPYYYRRYYYGSVYYFPYDFNYYYYHHPIYHYPPNYFSQKVEYVDGSITLNVFDRRLNKLVWSGTARGDVLEHDFINENIHPAVEAIMQKYPIKAITNRSRVKKSDIDDIYN